MARQNASGGVAERRDVQRADGLFPCVYVDLYPTAAIVVGAWVAIDTSVSTVFLGQHCVTAPTSGQMVVGVAATAAAAASTTVPIKVQIAGIFSTDGGATAAQASVATAVAAGVALMTSTTVAGQAVLLVDGTPTTAHMIGRTLEVAASSLARVIICDPGGLAG